EAGVQAATVDKEPGRRFAQAERVREQELLPAGRGGEQLRVVERDREEPARRHQPRPEDGQALLQRRLHAREEARTEQNQAVHQGGVAALQGHAQLAAPGDRYQKYRQPLALRLERLQELGEVVEQAPETGCFATGLLVQAGATAIEEEDAETRLAELVAGVFVPAAVALDAVNEQARGEAPGFRRL